MRKVVHIVYSFGTGGLERVIVNLINNVNAPDIEHHIVTLINDQSFAVELRNPVQFHCLFKKDGMDLLCHWRLFKLLKTIKPDIVQTYNFGTIEYQATGWLAGAQILIHAEHGRESSYKKNVKSKKYENFRKIIIPLLDNFVVVSKDLEAWAQQRLSLKNNKLRLIYNGIDLKEFSLNNADLSGTPFTFVSVGRLVDVKNHSLLIDSFYHAIENEPRMSSSRLVIVGDGPNMENLRQQIEALGLCKKVILEGNRNDVPSVLNQSQVFVLSSKYEAMPMTALEAMASGLPVIAPKVGGVEYILKNKINGLLIKPNDAGSLADAFTYAVKNRSELASMGSKGRDMVEKEYSVSAMCEKYLRLYSRA